MEQNKKTQLLDYIGAIYEEAKECKLSAEFFDKADEKLSFLASYFRCSNSQAFFISIVFAMNYKGDTVDLRDLIDYFECNPIRILAFNDDLKHLQKTGIFKQIHANHRANHESTKVQYVLNKVVSDAVLNRQEMPITKEAEQEDIFSVLEQMYELGQQRDNDEIISVELFYQCEIIISNNLHYPLIKKLHQLKYSMPDKYLLIYMIWKTVTGIESTNLGRALEGIYDHTPTKLNYLQKLISGQNPLVKNQFIELENAQFFDDTEIKLAAKAKELLNSSGVKLFGAKKKNENIIYPKDTPLRNLFYNEEELKQLNMLRKLIEDKQLKATQSRLKSKGLPIGVTVLLHGSPGTGKTETVKQLAKQTKREIMKIDMSATKSMWFGESQKIVKRIFTDYKALVQTCKRTPILLFNEADALISKRMDAGSSNTSQTENAIQNILLEELENFEGILMATTNLAANLDSAFERRFLFKLKFHKPSLSNKAQIWQHNLSHLSFEECEGLAKRFDFSGGQIENIVRKAEIHEIIHGGITTLKEIVEFCLAELLVESKIQIGFNNK